jgi:hypothetical protein
MPPPVSIPFAKFQEFRKRFIKFVSPLSEDAVQMEALQQNSVFELPLEISPLLFVDVAPLPIDSKFLIFTRPFVIVPLSHTSRRSSTPPPPRQLTQTYFSITSSGSDSVTRSSVNLRTIPFHEHLTLQQDEHVTSSSGRVFIHEDTEPPSSLGLQFHEPPD